MVFKRQMLGKGMGLPSRSSTTSTMSMNNIEKEGDVRALEPSIYSSISERVHPRVQVTAGDGGAGPKGSRNSTGQSALRTRLSRPRFVIPLALDVAVTCNDFFPKPGAQSFGDYEGGRASHPRLTKVASSPWIMKYFCHATIRQKCEKNGIITDADEGIWKIERIFFRSMIYSGAIKEEWCNLRDEANHQGVVPATEEGEESFVRHSPRRKQ